MEITTDADKPRGFAIESFDKSDATCRWLFSQSGNMKQ